MRQRVRFGWLVGALAAAVALASLLDGGTAAQTPAAGDRPRVVATFSILGDLVAQVGGDAISLRTIVGPGADTHTFEPSPEDAIALAEADVVFANGLGFEPWLDRLAEGADAPPLVVVVTAGIALRTVDGAPVEAEGGGGGSPGAVDPHVWHDVRNAIAMTEAIRDALVAADSANAAAYEANAAAAIARLEALDAWVVARVATLPPERRKLVTSHDTFGYFADRYGFAIVGTAFGSLTTEGGDPSARQIADLVAQIEAAGVPAIFAENIQNPALMESIAAEAGVMLGPPLYTDALGGPGDPVASYEAMIRHNVDAIVGALGG